MARDMGQGPHQPQAQPADTPAVTSETPRDTGEKVDSRDPRTNAVLRQALQQVGAELGLSDSELARAVGQEAPFLDPAQETAPIDDDAYRRIGLMLRLHESLSAVLGHNRQYMRGWMGAWNNYTDGRPAQQLEDPQKLDELVEYVEAFNL